MSRGHQTLRVFIADGIVRMPNVVDISSNRYGYLKTALDFFKELAEGHGSKECNGGEHTYWETKFEEHELHAIRHWFSWHTQYELIESMDLLWVVPVET